MSVRSGVRWVNAIVFPSGDQDGNASSERLIRHLAALAAVGVHHVDVRVAALAADEGDPASRRATRRAWRCSPGTAPRPAAPCRDPPGGRPPARGRRPARAAPGRRRRRSSDRDDISSGILHDMSEAGNVTPERRRLRSTESRPRLDRAARRRGLGRDGRRAVGGDARRHHRCRRARRARRRDRPGERARGARAGSGGPRLASISSSTPPQPTAATAAARSAAGRSPAPRPRRSIPGPPPRPAPPSRSSPRPARSCSSRERPRR